MHRQIQKIRPFTPIQKLYILVYRDTEIKICGSVVSTQKKDLQNRPIGKEDFQFAGQWGSRNYRPQVDS